MDDPKMELYRGMGLRIARTGRLRMVFGLALLLASLLGQAEATAQSAKWIWSPKVDSVTGDKPQGDCYFRSKFTLIKPEKAEVIYAAGDEYELYINNRLVSKGESYGSESKLDVFSYMKPGVNLVAIKVAHLGSSQPGVALKVRVKERDENSLAQHGNQRHMEDSQPTGYWMDSKWLQRHGMVEGSSCG